MKYISIKIIMSVGCIIFEPLSAISHVRMKAAYDVAQSAHKVGVELFKKSAETNVSFVAPTSTPRPTFTFEEKKLLVDALVIPLVVVGGGIAALYFMRKKFETKKFDKYIPQQSGITFADVAGAQAAKKEFSLIVDFIKNQQHYQRLGARVHRGVLLYGLPGDGKTLIARAVAGESGCSFFPTKGSDFVSKWVGDGATMIREIFESARKHAPSIIFIDEIDSIAHKRGDSEHNQERNVTLNQLLAEMDGFEPDKNPIIVIGATNRQNFLDPALLRAGRLEQHIAIERPDYEARLKIIELHAKQAQSLLQDVNFAFLAEHSNKFSGADMEKLVNDTLLHAVHEKKQMLMQQDFVNTLNEMRRAKNMHCVSMSLTTVDMVRKMQADQNLVH